MKKKKKSVKRKLNIKNIIIILIFMCVFTGGYLYYNNKNITNIVITGTNILEDYEIIEVAGIKNYPEIFTLSSSTLKEKIMTLDLVNTVDINKSLTGELEIVINEAIPLFYYMSTDSYILSNNTESNISFYGLPSVINYIPDSKYVDFINNFKNVDMEVINAISEIEYSPSTNSSGDMIDEDRFILTMNDDNTVYVNIINIEKLNNYFDIYDVIIDKYEDKRGVLMLDSGNDASVFKTYEAIAEEDVVTDED